MPPQSGEQDKAVERAVNGMFDDRLLSGTNLYDATDEELLGTSSPPVVRPNTSTAPPHGGIHRIPECGTIRL